MNRLRPLVRPLVHVAAYGFAVLLIAWLGLLLAPRPRLLEEVPFSPCALDRHGALLHLGLANDDRYRVFTPLEQISPTLIELTLLHEDRFYYAHTGCNPLAIARAAWADWRGHGARLGASTLTMQLARLHYRLHTRTYWGKLAQIVLALHLECHYSKHDLLEAYLNLAPYGRNIEGVGAASRIYFQRAPGDLSAVEALTLAAVPQSPSHRAPGVARHRLALEKARSLLLDQWLAAHPEQARLRAVLAMPLAIHSARALPFRAPHLVLDRLSHEPPSRQPLVLSLDLSRQEIVERQITCHLAQRAREGLTNACAILLDYRTMEVEACVGSADFRSLALSGQVDGTRASRSPGSALKPFIYALAIDQGLIHPNSVLLDAPTNFNGYNPEDFDRQYLGPIRACDALTQSRNVPAVLLASRLPAGRDLHALLQAAGIARLQPAEHYGLSIALGGAEISPRELAELYAALAQGGQLRPLRYQSLAQTAPPTEARQLFSPEAAWLTLDMLTAASRPDALPTERVNRLSAPVAWKTGTSFSFRDAWTAGVFDTHVLVVWVGNFDGTPNPALVGRSAAAPLFFSMVDALRATEPSPVGTRFDRAPQLNLRQVELCAESGALAGPTCPRRHLGWFIPGVSPIGACPLHRTTVGPLARNHSQSVPTFVAEAGPRIVSPKSGLRYHLRVGQLESGVIPLQAKAQPGARTLHWFVDARSLGATRAGHPLLWTPTEGLHLLQVVDEQGRADSRRVEITAVR